MMKETQNTIRNYLRTSGDINACPKCGRAAYALGTADGMYYVGCIHCGLHNGMSTSLLVDADDDIDLEAITRLSWNERCLNDGYNSASLQAMDIEEGAYIVIDGKTCNMAGVFNTMREAKDYILSNGYLSFSIWVRSNGVIQDIGRKLLIKDLYED